MPDSYKPEPTKENESLLPMAAHDAGEMETGVVGEEVDLKEEDGKGVFLVASMVGMERVVFRNKSMYYNDTRRHKRGVYSVQPCNTSL